MKYINLGQLFGFLVYNKKIWKVNFLFLMVNMYLFFSGEKREKNILFLKCVEFN